MRRLKAGDVVEILDEMDTLQYRTDLGANPLDMVGRLGIVAGPSMGAEMYAIWVDGLWHAEALPFWVYELRAR